MSAQASIQDGCIYIYNPNTLAREVWTGAVTGGGGGGGTVDQGAAGSQAWLVDGSAVTQPVSGTFWQTTQPVSLATMPSTPVTSATFATSAKQDTLQTSVDAINTKTPALGQAVAGSSTPVVLPAAQITTLTPPAAITGYALEAGHLAAIDTSTAKIPALGQALAAASVPVVLTAAQLTTLTPVSTITANAGTNLNTSSLSLETTQVAMSAKLPATLGQKAMTASLPVVIASNQSTVPVSLAAASVLFKGRANTFRTPGRAGTAGQKILSLHNATGSPVVVSINKVFVDLMQTVIKAITVAPPVIRCWKVTVLPTNGTALTKTKIGGTSSSNAAVTVLGDASADGTGSGTTLTATLPAGTFITQEFAPRFITAAGYEMADRVEFFGDTTVELQALEGIVLFLDYTLATQNPTTDMWVAGIEWTEV